jgi:ligand-binding sensor domain-containing protein
MRGETAVDHVLNENRVGGPVGRRRFQPNHFSKSPLAGSNVYTLLASPSGEIWIGTDHGLAVTDPDLQQVRVIGPETGFAGREVFDLAEDASGSIWAATECGIFSESGDKWHTCTGLPRDVVLAVAVAPDGKTVWGGSHRNGLIEIQDRVGRLFSPKEPRIRDTIFVSVAVAPDGTVWAGTPDGLIHFDGQNWTLYDHRNSGLPSTQIRAVAVDSRGKVWVATPGGVSGYTPGADSPNS